MKTGCAGDRNAENIDFKTPSKTNLLYSVYHNEMRRMPGSQTMNLAAPKELLAHSKTLLQVAPHSVLTLTSPLGAAGVGFTFTSTHDDYKKMIGVATRAALPTKRKVLILDSGVDLAAVKNVTDHKNFVDPADASNVTDETGHGTAVANIIQDIAPFADLVIYKVADKNGRASEWDTLAALAADTGAAVINMSLAFGLTSWNTPTCGRESQSSRSAVFESMIDQLANIDNGPILVAAAGNESKAELSFPARFKTVVAVESVDLSNKLSDFSNHSTLDHDGNAHPTVFVLPGGQQPTGSKKPTEYIGTTNAGQEFCGTSFAAAYASGLITALWSDPSHVTDTGTELLTHLKSKTDASPSHGYILDHGKGLMKFVV